MYQRIFGRSEEMPRPEQIQDRLREVDADATVTFQGDAEGWRQAEFLVGPGEPLVLDRYVAGEEGIRAELNSWAGYLETCEHSPHHVPLMERTIQTRQLFVLGRPDDHPEVARLDRVCDGLCRFLAGVTDGYYQADGLGFFEADGTLLVREE